MRGVQAVDAILTDNHGVIRIAEHRSLRSTVWRLVRAGTLVRPFPGVYIAAASSDDSRCWLAALCAWRPDAVITGEVALGVATGRIPSRRAALPRVVMYRSHETRSTRRVTFRCRAVPPEHAVRIDGIRIHVAPAAAVETAARDGGAAIDLLLREGNLDPHSLPSHLAIHRHCPGNPARRRVVKASMTRPFSAGERALHRLLERAGITEWIANPRLRVGSETLFPDTYFPDSRLVVEFDGRKFHGPEQFERDRERQNLLVSHGYTVLRFTWAIITTRPHEVIALIRRTLRLLQAA